MFPQLPTETLLKMANGIKNRWDRLDFLTALQIDNLYYGFKHKRPFPREHLSLNFRSDAKIDFHSFTVNDRMNGWQQLRYHDVTVELPFTTSLSQKEIYTVRNRWCDLPDTPISYRSYISRDDSDDFLH